MSWDRIEGSWRQLRGRVREQWGKLTDDDLDVIAGKRDILLGVYAHDDRTKTAKEILESAGAEKIRG